MTSRTKLTVLLTPPGICIVQFVFLDLKNFACTECGKQFGVIMEISMGEFEFLLKSGERTLAGVKATDVQGVTSERARLKST